jgi:hypothetical protein
MTTRVIKTLTTIEINNNGNIQCTPDDGHVRAPQGTQLEWVSNVDFTLSFTQLGGGGTWPFEGRQPAEFEPTKHFKGTLAASDTYPPPAYKYTVRVGSKVLDPIIIVDK